MWHLLDSKRSKFSSCSVHSRSGERWVATIDCLLVGQHVSNGANSRFWQLPTQKANTWWATTFPSSGLAIGHVFGNKILFFLC